MESGLEVKIGGKLNEAFDQCIISYCARLSILFPIYWCDVANVSTSIYFRMSCHQ